MDYLCKCDPCTCGVSAAGQATFAAGTGSEQRPGGEDPVDGRMVHRPRSARRPAPGRTALCTRATAALEPSIGAHLITPRRGYTHHGIYVGDGRVLHYAGLARDFRRGPVEEVSLARFANHRPVHIECRSTLALDEQEIVSRARSRIGENRYRLLTNNCEHFSEWSQFGASRSHQVERWFGSAATITRALAAKIGRGLAKVRPDGRVGASA